MKSSRSTYLFILSLVTFGLYGCDSNEPDEAPNEQELITRVVLTLTDGSVTHTITAGDPEGDGQGLTFTPATLTLSPGTFEGTISIYNDEAGELINEEIEEEAGVHLFRYTAEGGIAGRVTVTLTDRESDYPAGEFNERRDVSVGLDYQVIVSTGSAAAGSLNVTLYHFDDGAIKNNGTSQSNERDIDIDFPVAIAAP